MECTDTIFVRDDDVEVSVGRPSAQKLLSVAERAIESCGESIVVKYTAPILRVLQRCIRPSPFYLEFGTWISHDDDDDNEHEHEHEH